MDCFSGDLYYDVPVREFLNIEYLRERNKYRLTFLTDDYIIMDVYASSIAFKALVEQSKMITSEGIYARFCGDVFCYIVLGVSVRFSEYRLLREYNFAGKQFYPHVPQYLPPEKNAEIHESLRDE